ncbi:MAG: hypothetical protein JNK14_20450 [Chitinophagaceae bacterium]|nr:hypothetical protein [Chitinophagaceae bacterium]
MKKINNIIKTFSIALLLIISVASKAQTQAVGRTASAENKVAILPITYIGEGNEVKLEQMRYSLQNIAHRCLQEGAFELKFQDPAETNALLLRNGVRESNFREFTPKELAEILQVEYVLIGMVSQETEAILTVSNSRRSFNTREYYDRHHHVRNERNSSSNTRTSQDVNTTVDLVIYNDKGEKIYSRSRKSLLSNMDTYKAGLQYLLKRTPLYKK